MIRCIDFNGLQAVEFSKGDYTALLIPSMGANLVRLCHTGLGVEVLRTPAADEIETFLRRPHVFGVPILLPPNRIADGCYTFEGRTYRFPITIEKEHNYHHGILKSQPFQVSKALERDDEVLVECRYYSNPGCDAIFRDFPHAFKCKITYRLTAGGLEQEVMFANRSTQRMPLGVGFREGGLRVTGCDPIEAGFTLREIDVDGKPFRGALVENLRTGVRTFYEVDDRTIYWTIWNNGGQVPYCCPEPQTWITDAPHAADPEAAGFRSVAPGESWRARYRFYVK